MPDFGFIHPNGNYFQAFGDTLEDIKGLPEGTINVPLRPSDTAVWDGTQWVEGGAPDTAQIDQQILTAPDDLFGGPTLGEIFNGN